VEHEPKERRSGVPVDRARWDHLKEVFQGALDRPANQRRAWLAGACAGDETLLREAEALLASHDTAGEFLEEPARIDPADLEGLPADTQLGPYRVLEEIGRGGMGVVYLAEDSRLGRRVALKALPPVVAANPELQQRLRREARAAATITHPAVATVYALEEIDGHLVIVSEYVAGETLRGLIARGPIEPAKARAFGIQIAGALAAAHDAGVVHRDLKPENVLITPTGDVKVVDFGIAHVEGPEATRLTRAGAMLGTPAYMAPEQLLGAAVDNRADIYAFGVLLSEMTTGKHPLSAVATPSPTPAPFATIVARCIQPDPAARFPSARELLGALEQQSPSAGVADSGAAGSARWWWEFHQGMAALVYWIMTIPAWTARGVIGGALGRTLFIVTLASVVIAANIRFHLWFTSRFYPGELRWARRRTQRWTRAGDWGFVSSLAIAGLLVGEANAVLAIVLISVSIGTMLAFLVMERVTARAAFRSSAAR
jgi:predicted Ser/Thr protein kinase